MVVPLEMLSGRSNNRDVDPDAPADAPTYGPRWMQMDELGRLAVPVSTRRVSVDSMDGFSTSL